MSLKCYAGRWINDLPLESVQTVADDTASDLDLIVSLRLLTQHGISPEKCTGIVVIDEMDQMELINKVDLVELKNSAVLSEGRNILNKELLGRLKFEKVISANLQKELTELKAQIQNREVSAPVSEAKTGKKKLKKKPKDREDSSTEPGRDDSSTEPGQDDVPVEASSNAPKTNTALPSLEEETNAGVESPDPVTPVAPSEQILPPLTPASPATKALEEEMIDLRTEFVTKHAALQGALDGLLSKFEEQGAAVEALTQKVLDLQQEQKKP